MKKLFLLLMIVCVFTLTGCNEIENFFPAECIVEKPTEKPAYDPTTKPTGVPTPVVTPWPTGEPISFWAKEYETSVHACSHSIQETSDNGFMVFGHKQTPTGGYCDFFVLKLDSAGELNWSKVYEGKEIDYAYTGIETSDGSYIIAGQSCSFGDVRFNAWVLKLSSNGAITWQKQYGGTGYENIFSIIETTDNKYVLAGITGPLIDGNMCILKIFNNGDIKWYKVFGGKGMDIAYSIQQTPDNGFIIAGQTDSFGAGGCDGWVLKLDGKGNIKWQKILGSSGYDTIKSIQLTPDNGFIMTGTYAEGSEGSNFWVIRMNSRGEILWQKIYSGPGLLNRAEIVQVTPDGGYIVGGGGWIIKLTGIGDIEWQKAYIGPIYSLRVTSDSGFIVVGRGICVLKLNESGECTPLGSDISVTTHIPTPVITIPSDVEITAKFDSSDTNCTVDENPDITVIQLAP